MSTEGVGGVFSAAHDEFALWSARLWRPLGEILTAVSRPGPGERVLDACCGAGASAIPAARAVGPTGAVHAVDLAEKLVARGAREAEALGLSHVRFETADVLTYDGGPYDVVQSAYGVFFFPNMDEGARTLVSTLRPGGRFAVSTWLTDGMARIVPVGRDAALPERPDLAGQAGKPSESERVDTPEGLSAWLSSLGLRDVSVREVRYVQPLHPDDAWTFYLGGAMRGFVRGLDPEALERVRVRFLAGLREARMDTLDGSSLIGVGYRDGGR